MNALIKRKETKNGSKVLERNVKVKKDFESKPGSLNGGGNTLGKKKGQIFMAKEKLSHPALT